MLGSRMPNTKGPRGADLAFRVQSLPIAKPRQSRRDAWEPSKAVQSYRFWSDLVRKSAKRAYHGPGWGQLYQGAVALSCEFYFPIPASWSKVKRAKAAAGNVFHTSKPDLDNLMKGIKDPLSDLIWVDDRQVVEYWEPCIKRYGTAEHVGAWVNIWFLE